MKDGGVGPMTLMLDPAVPAHVARRMSAVVARAGLELRNGPPATVLVSPLHASGGEPLRVTLYDGHLDATARELLARAGPVFLLAGREEDGAPAPWELAAVSALLRPVPLLADYADSVELGVGSHEDIARAASAADQLARAHGAGRATAVLVSDATHELAANALLDAPVDAGGRPKYAHRRSDLVVDRRDGCTVRLAIDGGRIWIAARDRFARLGRAPLLRAADLLGAPARVDPSGGGAGLGLLRVLQAADLLAARVERGESTEVMCAVDLGPGRRRATAPKSILLLGVEP